MNLFTNSELTDNHFVYSLANGNVRTTVQLYWEKCPTGCEPNNQMFARVYHNFAERGSVTAMMQDTGLTRNTRTPILEEVLLHAVDRNSRTIVWASAAATGTPRSTFHRVCRGSLTTLSCSESSITEAG